MNMDFEFPETARTFDPEFVETSETFSADFGTIQTVTEFVGGDPYAGDYTVTPKVDAQTMPTKNKVMLDDVTIREIPIYEVSNNSGGRTVYIAKEV